MHSKKEEKERKRVRRRKIIVIAIVFLWLFSMVASSLAVKPVQTSYVGIGLVLETPLQEIQIQDQDVEYHVHIFNASNGIMINSSEADCIYEVYDQSGEYIINNGVMEKEGSEFEIDVGGDNFSILGLKSLSIYCNASGSGGFSNRVFEVTPNGVVLTDGLAMVYLGLLFMVLILTTLSIVGIFKVENVAGKYALIGTSYLLSIATTFFAWSIAENYLTASVGLVNVLFLIFRILLVCALPFFIVSFLAYLFEFRKMQQIKSLLEKGVPEDEALERKNKKW